MQLLGIDNVFFEVRDVTKASAFYQKLGFKPKLKIPQIKAELFSIGVEDPGLILCEKEKVSPSKMWVEVEDASHIKSHMDSLGLNGQILETATGKTYQVTDDSGNVIGFADYCKKPELSKKTPLKIALLYSEEVWNQKNTQAIDDLMDPKIVIHSLLGNFEGPSAMKKVVKEWLTGFPDLKVTVMQSIEEKNLVMLQWKAEGTHLGLFKGKAPKGKKVNYQGVSLYLIRDGKIVEYWGYLDMQHLFNQIE